MDPRLLFGIWILYNTKLGFCAKVGYLGKRNEVIYLLAIVLEVEAGVTEGRGKVNYGLPNFVDLLLCRDLEIHANQHWLLGHCADKTYWDLDFFGVRVR
jgi:hypothetical protein